MYKLGQWLAIVFNFVEREGRTREKFRARNAISSLLKSTFSAWRIDRRIPLFKVAFFFTLRPPFPLFVYRYFGIGVTWSAASCYRRGSSDPPPPAPPPPCPFFSLARSDNAEAALFSIRYTCRRARNVLLDELGLENVSESPRTRPESPFGFPDINSVFDSYACERTRVRSRSRTLYTRVNYVRTLRTAYGIY